MQNTTKNYKLTLTKEIGNVWILENIQPFHKDFKVYYDQEMGHDIVKLTVIGATGYVLDILAGDRKRMDIDLRVAAERMDLPDYVEFELVQPSRSSAKYLVNNCPGKPQLIAWVNASVRQIIREYPVFAYIKRK